MDDHRTAHPAVRNGEISHWMSTLATRSPHRTRVEGAAEYDVAIVGGGLTALWSAYYLTRLTPGLSVGVLEAESVGFGASGRNGGWLSHLVPGNRARIAGRAGHDATVELQRAMLQGVDEVLSVVDSLGLDVDQSRGGNLVVATTPAGMRRLRQRREADLRFGLDERHVHELTARESAGRINAKDVVGALSYPMVAATDPAKLVTGLAEAVEARGVVIHEGSRVTSVSPGMVSTAAGTVRAGSVLLCTEGYSGPLVGRRRIVPINSSMIATAPLTAEQWDTIGWSARECFSDAMHTFVYAQRTKDGRIAIGGRGAPYRFGSGVGTDGSIPERTIAELVARIGRYFPDLDVQVDHAWSGVLGVTRDWSASVAFDRSTRIGHAYGYGGHGVTATHVAARSMVDLVLGRDTSFSRLPWVGHVPPSWEPEPVRWLAIHSMYQLFRLADQWEESRQSVRTSVLARVGGRLAGLSE